MATNKRVLICIPTLLPGGTEMHTLSLSRALIRGGYDVHVCSYYENSPIMLDSIRTAGVDVIPLNLSRSSSRTTMGQLPQLWVALRRVIRQLRPGFIHVQYMKPGIVPVLAGYFSLGTKLLGSIHFPGHAYGNRMWTVRAMSRMCDAFLCASKIIEKSFFGDSCLFDTDAIPSGRTHFTINNCVDMDEIQSIIDSGAPGQLRKRIGFENAKLIVMVARISGEKGYDVLLRAMPEIADRFPEAHLVIAGDGPERNKMLGIMQDLHLERFVTWVGAIPKRSALELLAAADVVAVPSRYEGFGIVAAEAMACGRAVVASRVDGLCEVITDSETGLLVRAGDRSALAQTVIRLLEQPELSVRLGAAGRDRVSRNFSFEIFARRHLDLYDCLARR